MPTTSSPTSPKPSIAPSSTPADGSRRLGAIMLVTVVLAWGVTWPVNKVLLDTLPPLWLSALRSAIGAVALVVLFNPIAFDWRDRNAVIGNLAILAAALLWAASIVHVRGHRWHATPFALLPWEMLLAA